VSSAVNTPQGGALFALYPQLAEHNDKEDTTMNKLISIIVAGAFAGASISAIAQAPKAATPAPAATAPAATPATPAAPAKAEAPKAEAKADAKAAKSEKGEKGKGADKGNTAGDKKEAAKK
jgi:hypothetical protein